MHGDISLHPPDVRMAVAAHDGLMTFSAINLELAAAHKADIDRDWRRRRLLAATAPRRRERRGLFGGRRRRGRRVAPVARPVG
ncbi:MAG: hypothetical protein QOH72_5700 [Solirubrobacteraceae bacterium]|nr:hypothetical protein [Solirubrobacteraceae bacterium]